MEQLSELDASFLYMEHESTPMHIGAVYVLNCEQMNNPLGYQDFCHHLTSRLHIAPRLRQRLVEVPLHLDHPYWSDDPEFNLENHVSHLYMQDTCDRAELLSIAAQFLVTPLKRSQPLWEIALIEGLHDPENLPNTSSAILVKTHHSAIDGVTGEELMSVLLDLSPQVEPPADLPKWRPKPLPSKAKMISNVYGSALNTPFRLAHMARDAAASAFYSLLIQRLRKIALPHAFFSAPYTKLNQPISRDRSYSYHEFPLDRLKNIKRSAAGITLNDIVMTICSEVALRFLQQETGKTPESSLIALSPISVRSKRIDSPTGGELSALLLSLATTEPNLAIRLKKIHDNASASKIYRQAIAANRLTRLIPSAMMGLAARVYTEFQLAQRHKPLFNIPITNIPGPETYLYFAGARVDYQFAAAPLFDGIGLVIMVMSYAEKVTFTFTACPKVVPNLTALAEDCAVVLSQLETDLETVDFTDIENNTESDSPGNVLTALLSDMVTLFKNLFSGIEKDSTTAPSRNDERK